jgi:hypothetical protein
MFGLKAFAAPHALSETDYSSRSRFSLLARLVVLAIEL